MNFCLCCPATLFCLITQQGQNLVFLTPFVAMGMTLLSLTRHYHVSAGLKMRHTGAVRVWCFQQICSDKPLIYGGSNLHTLKSMGDLLLTLVSATGLCTETTKWSRVWELLVHEVQPDTFTNGLGTCMPKFWCSCAHEAYISSVALCFLNNWWFIFFWCYSFRTENFEGDTVTSNRRDDAVGKSRETCGHWIPLLRVKKAAFQFF